MYVCIGMHILLCMCGSQRNLFSLSSMCGPGAELGASGLVASALSKPSCQMLQMSASAFSVLAVGDLQYLLPFNLVEQAFRCS